MKVVGIIIFVLLAIFVLWFTIDTFRVCAKKIKEKKARKQAKTDSTDDVINQ